jgi:DNA primase
MKFAAIDFFKDYSIPYWTYGKNVTPGWVNIKCPFCSDTSNHLGINQEKGYCTCWKCGWHSIESVIFSLTGKRDLLGKYNYVIKQNISKSIEKIDFKLPGEPITDFHIKYLISRGFDPDLLVNLYRIRGVLGCPTQWKYRLIIPIYFNGVVVSFQSRACFDTDMRYITCSQAAEIIHHKDIFYNTDNSRGDTVILVEGVFDVWKMGDNCISGFGTEITSAQTQFLVNYYKKVIVLFDAEREAYRKAVKIANEISVLGGAAEVIDWKGTDPGDLSYTEARELKHKILKE